jgi:hypothetical protein
MVKSDNSGQSISKECNALVTLGVGDYFDIDPLQPSASAFSFLAFFMAFASFIFLQLPKYTF